MSVRADQIVHFDLPVDVVKESIGIANRVASSIIDRSDLHERDYLERFIDCLMGELAERMVISWLITQNKYASSAVDKDAASPDPGHDIWLKDIQGNQIRGSVKSSISMVKNNPNDILNTFTLATKFSELKEINVQVYFWLDSRSTPRVAVPTLRNSAIFAWARATDLSAGNFAAYRGEGRPAPTAKLATLRPIEELLTVLA